MRLILLTVLGVLIAFVLRMNLTLGFYQDSCACRVDYMTAEIAAYQKKYICPLVGACVISPVEKVINSSLLLLGNLDFNR